MHCQEIEELLSSYIDKEISETQMRLVEAHLAGCPDCVQTLAILKQVAAEVGALPPLEMPRDARDRLAAAIDRRLKAVSGGPAADAGQTAAPWWRWFARPAFLSTAGAFAVVVFAVAMWQAPGQKRATDLRAPALQSAPQADAPSGAGELKQAAPEVGAQSESEAAKAPPPGFADRKNMDDGVFKSFTRGELDKMAETPDEGEDRLDYRTAPSDASRQLFGAVDKTAGATIDATAAARTAAADKPAKVISATLGVFEERVAWVVVFELKGRPGNYKAAAVDAENGRLLYSTGN